jgi:hypothetical protein
VGSRARTEHAPYGPRPSCACALSRRGAPAGRSLPVIHRLRLAVVAGHRAGLAGSLAFDLRQEAKANAYFAVALQAADDANSPDLAAWALATRSLSGN